MGRLRMRVVTVAALGMVGAGVARADVTFDFTIKGLFGEAEPYSTVGQFTAVDLGPVTGIPGSTGMDEEYRITGVTGEFGGTAITGLAPVGVNDVDERLDVESGAPFAGAPVEPPNVVPSEVAFTIADGHTVYLEHGQAAPELVVDPQDLPYGYGEYVQFNVSLPEAVATPEPGTMGLVGTGVLGVGMVRRRMRG